MEACGHWGRSRVSDTSSPSSLLSTVSLAFSSLLWSQWQPVARGPGKLLRRPRPHWRDEANLPSSSLAVWSYTLYYLEKRGKAVASMLWRPPLERPLAGATALGCVPCSRVASTAINGYSSNVRVRRARGCARCWERGISQVSKTGPGHHGAEGKPR